MKPAYNTRRHRRRSAPSRAEGVFFKKESQYEQGFFGESSHDTFFQPAVANAPVQNIQRACDKCKEEEKVQRVEEKKEEKFMKMEEKKEEKVMKKEDKKEEEKVMKKEDKKEEEKVMKKEDKKEEEKVMKKEDKKEEEKVMKKEDKKEEEKVMKKEDKKEEEKVQKKEAGGIAPANGVSNYISSLNGKGHALSSKDNHFFSSRMGYDFSNVKIHNDKEAADSAKDVNAKAYTIGNNVVFNEGQYNTESSEGKKLMAHELTHITQQQPADEVNRKIVVGGSDYTPKASYYDYLRKNFGETMVEFIEQLHNNGNPPAYSFKSYEEMGYEVRIRYYAIKGMEEVHKGCCNYPTSEPNGYLNPLYWKRNGYMDFTLNPTLPAGKQPSDAVESIFAPAAGTQLECLTMTTAIEYYSLLKGLGKDKFNKKFAGGSQLIISVRSLDRGGDIVDNEYKSITATRDELLPGDWVYFKNFRDYPTKYPDGFWRGENAIVMSKGMYRGFGVANQSETDLNKELVKQYNDGLPASDKKTLADLLAEGGGLQQSPVFRPNTGKLVK